MEAPHTAQVAHLSASKYVNVLVNFNQLAMRKQFHCLSIQSVFYDIAQTGLPSQCLLFLPSSHFPVQTERI